MIRTLAAAGGLSLALLAGGAAAQTWGQPVYVSPYGHGVGGTPLSEVETRSYVNTGRWADGYSDQAYVYLPAPGYGPRYGHDRGYGYGHDRYDRDRYGRGRSGYGQARYEPRSGYRDVWGYNDDRHPSARGWSRDRGHDYHDSDCGCPDVYLYDR